MGVQCPNCQNAIEWTDTEVPTEIVCAACGSRFRLADAGSTAGWDRAAPRERWAGFPLEKVTAPPRGFAPVVIGPRRSVLNLEFGMTRYLA